MAAQFNLLELEGLVKLKDETMNGWTDDGKT